MMDFAPTSPLRVRQMTWEDTQAHKHELLLGPDHRVSRRLARPRQNLRKHLYRVERAIEAAARAYSTNVISETLTRKGNDGFRADVVVTCSAVEVFSPSNVGQVWTAKLFEYWNMPSTEQLVTIDSVKRSVASYICDEQGNWELDGAPIGEGRLSFPTVDVTVTFDEIYRGTSLDDR